VGNVSRSAILGCELVSRALGFLLRKKMAVWLEHLVGGPIPVYR
jgi:hypothetical protein